MMEMGVGGLALGFIDKSFPTLPTIPLLGRAGTIAVAAYFLGKGSKGGLFRDVALAASAISGYQLGNKGSVSGHYPPSVGIAAQI
jgi:hypothetical protein